MNYSPTYNNYFQPQLGETYSRIALVWMQEEPKMHKPKFGVLDNLLCFFSTRRLSKKLDVFTEYVLYRVKNFDVSFAKLSQEEMANMHRDTKQMLDIITSLGVHKIKPTHKTAHLSVSLNSFLDAAKEIELKMRVAAYPEKNTVLFTYDELAELAEAMKGFEPAEEQSEIYSLSH
jgi:hypothetical protein